MYYYGFLKLIRNNLRYYISYFSLELFYSLYIIILPVLICYILQTHSQTNLSFFIANVQNKLYYVTQFIFTNNKCAKIKNWRIFYSGYKLNGRICAVKFLKNILPLIESFSILEKIKGKNSYAVVYKDIITTRIYNLRLFYKINIHSKIC